MDKKFNFKRFVSNEYFPLELPKVFSTKDLAINYKSLLGNAKSTNISDSEPLSFTIYKNEKSRRLLSIPNPYHYLKLIDVIIENEKELFKIYDNSPYSITKPANCQKNIDNYAYSRLTNSVQETRTINESLYKGHNFCLKLDISSFFDSIYTHTISWAIHGKEYAKQHTDNKQLLGNKIDFAVRNLNRKQTNGILVGNACSRLLSEIILCSIDNDIFKEFPNIDICRYVDDYSIYFTNDISVKSVNGNSILEFVRLKLLDYNLQLNESKIILSQSPFVTGKKEIEQLRSIITNDCYVYFNNLLHIFKGTNDLSILKYGLKVLNYKISSNNFSQIQSMLLNLWCNYPSLTEEVLNIILRFKHLIKTRDLKKNILSVMLNRCILYRQDNELIWLLYACQQLNVSLNAEQIKEVFETENDLAIVIILFMEKGNKTKRYQDLLKKLETNLSKINNIFYSNRWLLVYEIVKNNFINNFRPKIDKFFKKLIDLNVDFYNKQYEHILEEKQPEAGEFITRDEFNQNIKYIYQLIGKAENKEIINKAITDLNKKLDAAFDNNYF